MSLMMRILETLKSGGPMGPGDVAQRLAAPRYRVLSTFHCLKELGLIEEVYSKGSYRIYTITLAGRTLLEEAEKAGGLAAVLERLALAQPGHGEAAWEAQISSGI